MVYQDATGLYHFVINVIPFISNSVLYILMRSYGSANSNRLSNSVKHAITVYKYTCSIYYSIITKLNKYIVSIYCHIIFVILFIDFC